MKGPFSQLICCLVTFAELAFGTVSLADEASISQALTEYVAAMDVGERDQRLQAFARAEQLFRQAIDQQVSTHGVANTELLVNFGNAALQAEHLGPAIVAYRRALIGQPSHQQARQNLQFARSLIPETVRVDQATQLVDTLFFWNSLISRSQLNLLGAVCFLLTALLMTLGFAFGSAWLRLFGAGLGLAWCVMLVSIGWDRADPSSEAVVVVDEAYLYSADSENSSLRLADPLPNGTELRILERRDRWLEIEVTGRTGWINASQVETITPE